MEISPFETLVALLCVISASVFSLVFGAKRRDWLQVYLSVAGLVVLAISSTVFWTYASWGPEVLPYGPILWIAIAALLLSLKVIETKRPTVTETGLLLPIALLAWTMVTVGSALMMLFVRHGVTATYDSVVLLGILTLGLAQLGFAGILEHRLNDSPIGRATWTVALVIGTVVLLFSFIVDFILMTSRIGF